MAAQQPPGGAAMDDLRFWEHGRPGPVSPDEMAMLSTMAVAMAVRNAVEDLHASGAFSDRQAPSFNSTVRNRLYAVMLALQRLDRWEPEERLVDLLAEQARIEDPALAGKDGFDPAQAVAGGVRGAIRAFGRAERLAPDVISALEAAAAPWALNTLRHLQTIERQASADQIRYLVSMVPRYWESPEIEPELRKYFAG